MLKYSPEGCGVQLIVHTFFPSFSPQLQNFGNPFRRGEKEGIKFLMLRKGLAAKKKSYLCGLLAFFGIGVY